MFSGRLEGVDTHASNIVERVFVQIHSQASGIALLGCCYSLAATFPVGEGVAPGAAL